MNEHSLILTVAIAMVLSTFRLIKLNASLADWIKGVPCKALIMYAFRLMNLMKFSTHSQKTRVKQRQTCINKPHPSRFVLEF